MDSIIGGHCINKNYPLIQLDGRCKLAEIKDNNKRAFCFGERIGEIIGFVQNKPFESEENEILEEGEVYNLACA